MTNNKLTDEKIKARINAIEDRRSASRDFWDGDWDYPEDIELLALRELQERRKAEAPGYPETLPCPVFLEPGLKFGKGVRNQLVFDALRRRADYYAELESMTLEQRAKHDAGIAEFKAMLHGSQPVSDRDELREQVRSEHAEWSDATFGDVGPVGPLKHLSKEALEAAADPSDPLEWADMQFLLWDAQRRMGISDEFITRAMIEKLEINKSRQWPEPKDGEPRLHIKEQPAPVVPDEWTIQDAVKFCRETGRQDAGSAMEAWNACRAAMLQGSQPVSDCDELSKKS